MTTDSDTFLGLTKAKFAFVMVVLVALSVTLCCVTLAITSSSTNADVNRNARTLTYLCSTTRVLDNLTLGAEGQIIENFQNGTYYKLERQGLVTAANIAAARKALVEYQAAHELLSSNGACKT